MGSMRSVPLAAACWVLAAACTTTPSHGVHGAPTGPAPSAVDSTASPYLSFRRGFIDQTGWHGPRDARVYPDGRLAVLTYGGGCAPRPVQVRSSGPHVVVVTYSSYGSARVCLAYAAPFTAIVRLPRNVQPHPPLRVTVELAGVSYTVPARG